MSEDATPNQLRPYFYSPNVVQQRMTKKIRNPDDTEALRRATGRRLAIVREVFGLQKGEFGKRAGIGATAYSMIESGERLPSVQVAIALCEAYGLTLDYIFRGDAGDIRHSLATAIEALSSARSENEGG